MNTSEWVARDLAQIKLAACAHAERIGRPWLLYSDQQGAALADTKNGVIWEKSMLGGPEVQGLMLFPDYASVQELIDFRRDDFAFARPMHVQDWPVHGEPGEMTLQVAPHAYLEDAQRMSDAVQVHVLPWSAEEGVVGVLMLDARLNLVAPENLPVQ